MHHVSSNRFHRFVFIFPFDFTQFLFCLLCIVYVACYVGIFSKLRSLNLLSEPFDERQFFDNEDEFEPANNPTGDLIIKSLRRTKREHRVLHAHVNGIFLSFVFMNNVFFFHA